VRVATPSRRYEQRARARAAEETRRRILDAAYGRLREAPAEPLAVDRIAQEAGVARSTVYADFGSRAGLLDAVGRDLVERAGVAELLEAVRVPDAREHLRGGIAAGARMFAAERDVFRALHALRHLDPDAVGAAISRSEEERARGMARLVRRLARQSRLRDGLSRRRAADTLWVLTGFEAFDTLYTGRGRPLDEVIADLTEMAERAVLAAP
jgi:AcrR family transcriptional regulator